MKQSETIRVADIDFVCSAETQNHIAPKLDVEITQVHHLTDTYLLYLTAEIPDHQSIPSCDFSVEWSIPIADMHGLYFGGNPRAEMAYLPFWQHTKQICANTGVPYISLINRNGENRAAFGAFDQITETSIKAELSEATRCYHFHLQKPANKDGIGQTTQVEGCWKEIFFISKAQHQWPEVLKNYVQLSDQTIQPAKMPVPERAFEPVFCTWTAIHHDVSHEWILRNAPLAADLGFATWITDDGWFIEQGHFGDYSYVGEWNPAIKKFPDFKQHVQTIQDLGFRYLLWVAPFMVGKDSEAAQRYAHLLTTGQEANGFNNLSPLHHETQHIIGDLLERLVREYNLDGLKIDFLDSFSVASVGKDAVDTTFGSSLYHLLQNVTERLLTINPDLLIEFRNSYANLASRSYANIYRSSDVPLNFSLNRWQAVMLRLLTPDRAVHLDPALWHPSDSDTNIAVHLINLIVSVPMVSIELDQYPQTHIDLIRYWIGFYNAHRDTIIAGDFRPELRLGYVPVIYFVGKQEIIIGLYDDVAVSLSSEKDIGTIWILNASTRPTLDISDCDLDGVYQVTTHDKFGCVVTTQPVHFPVAQLSVEVGGSIEILNIQIAP
jgi:alpha-galactosidase